MNSNLKYFINGKITKAEDSYIHIENPGFQRGYGTFETIRFNNRKLFNIERHIKRLVDGCSTVNIPLKYTSGYLVKSINETIKSNPLENGLAKLIITKKTDSGNETNLYIMIRPLYDIPNEPVRVTFFKEKDYPLIRFNPAIKSINYLGNMMALEDAKSKGAYEPVFISRDGFITECAIRNIFFIKGNKLLTPSLNLGVLPGVTREIIKDIADKIGLISSDSYISYSDINNMDEAFISSTGIGILSCFWDNWKSEYTKTKKLQFLLEETIKNN